MRLLAFAGAHDNQQVALSFLRRLEDLQPRPDLFISAGDLAPEWMVTIFEALSGYDRPILYILGNHCLHYESSLLKASLGRVQELPQVHSLAKDSFEFNGWSFVGQDALTDFTDDEKDLERYHDLVARTRGLSPDRTILVTHHAPLGVFDGGWSYPLHSFRDRRGNLHAGSLALRFFSEEFRPRCHIFAHLHSDGCRHALVGETFYANVCHLERRTKDGRYGITGSFDLIDLEQMKVTLYQLGALSPRMCAQCGEVNYLVYERCINCSKGPSDLILSEDLP